MKNKENYSINRKSLCSVINVLFQLHPATDRVFMYAEQLERELIPSSRQSDEIEHCSSEGNNVEFRFRKIIIFVN